MAEPVTETAAWDGDGAGGAETEIVPEGLAWSADDSEDDEPLPRQWRDVAGIAAAILAVCTLVTVMLVWGYHDWQATRRPNPWDLPGAHRTEDAQTSAARTTTRAPVGPWTAMPLPTATVEHRVPNRLHEGAQDASYVAALQRAGITVTNREAAVAAARSMCVTLAEGHSQDEIAASIVRDNPTFNRAAADATINAAIASYCPEQRRGD